MAKRFVNYNKCELNTMVKLTKNWVGFVHFYYPKKVEQYDSSLYPECATGEASNTFDDWMGGKDVDPVKKPIDKINSSDSNNEMTFGNEQKAENNSGLVEENNNLKTQIAELKAKLDAEIVVNQNLVKENAEYLSKVENLTNDFNTKTELKNKLELEEKQKAEEKGE